MPPMKLRGRVNHHRDFQMTDSKNNGNQKKGFVKSCAKVLFSHLGLFIIVAVYSIVGAYALISIEEKAEIYRFTLKKNAAFQIKQSRDYILQIGWYSSRVIDGKIRLSKDRFEMLLNAQLKLYHHFIVNKAINVDYDGNDRDWNYAWTFPKSLLFTVTTMGAIGYGHISPKTKNGQLFTVYYGMIGVPLLLLFLANIGEFLAKSFKYIYSRLCCRMCRIRRKVSQLRGSQTLESKALVKEEIGTENYMPTEFVDVPIMVNLVVIFVYLMMGGALFSFWEGWTLTESVYFTFITLTTIGFGDYVPGNAFSTGSGEQAFAAMMKMIVTVAFCIFGMALVSMAINLMQEQLVGKVKWVAKELGMGKEKDMSAKRYQIKKSPEGAVAITPPDKDGNKRVLLKKEDLPQKKQQPV